MEFKAKNDNSFRKIPPGMYSVDCCGCGEITSLLGVDAHTRNIRVSFCKSFSSIQEVESAPLLERAVFEGNANLFNLQAFSNIQFDHLKQLIIKGDWNQRLNLTEFQVKSQSILDLRVKWCHL